MSRHNCERDESHMGVVIPQYCGAELTATCCRTLLAVHERKLNVVVVDDGSGDAELQRLHSVLPAGVQVLARPRRGVTAAWNAGMKLLRPSRTVVLLNNDVISKGPWLERVQQLLQDNPLQLIGAEWHAARSLKSLTAEFRWPGSHPQLLAGWCLAFRREAARNVGLFDEQMAWYWSDTDWQFRWMRMYGRRRAMLQVLPQGLLQHAGQQTTRQQPERLSQWQSDREVFRRKWRPILGRRR